MANYWKLYKKIKAFYFSIGKIKCPALDDAEIIFDRRGFRHLLYKKKVKRMHSDQIRRFKLFENIHFLVRNSKLLDRKEEKGESTLLSLSCGDGANEIKMVVLNDVQNKKHFISIMDHK